MDITELRTETAEWDAFVRASGEGSPFQLVAWKRAVERTFGLRAHYLMARENGRLVGVLPLFEARELFGRRALISVPYAVRSEEHTSELQSRGHLVCRLLLEKKDRCR